jgi:hypothetical protein
MLGSGDVRLTLDMYRAAPAFVLEWNTTLKLSKRGSGSSRAMQRYSQRWHLECESDRGYSDIRSTCTTARKTQLCEPSRDSRTRQGLFERAYEARAFLECSLYLSEPESTKLFKGFGASARGGWMDGNYFRPSL